MPTWSLALIRFPRYGIVCFLTLMLRLVFIRKNLVNLVLAGLAPEGALCPVFQLDVCTGWAYRPYRVLERARII